MRFADVRVHDLAGRGHLEPLGSRFVSLDFWHGKLQKFQISDFRFSILDRRSNAGAGKVQSEI